MITMLILSLVLVISVMGIAIARERGLPDSISAIVYIFRHRWLWTIWLWLVALLTLIPCIEILSRIGMEFLGFGTLACLMFCGSMPLFDKEHITWHWITGIAGCILSQICVAIINPWCLILWLLMISAIWMKSKATFISETICFVTLIVCELMQH